MPTIESYVFMDLETTGFPWQENNETKITELAMVAVNRQSFLQGELKKLPRVLQKLTLCFRPNRNINHRVTFVTGLSNFDLENESQFDEDAVNTINGFLKRLKPPVCLIAHNGNCFDYPIFRAHFDNLKIKPIADTYCIDSLCMFKDILNSTTEEPIVQTATEEEPKESVDFELTVEEFALIDELERRASSGDLNLLKVIIHSAESTPEKQKINKVNRNIPGVCVTKKQLLPKKKPRQSYKLIDIYEKLLGTSPYETHRAESDCMILLESCIAKGAEFLKWSDENCVQFSDVPRMEPGKKFPRFNSAIRVCLFPD